jgi:hypothetical protein
MGYSKTKCFTVQMDAASLYLSCGTGYIAEIVDFGIQAKFEDTDLCIRNATGVCANSMSPTFN